MNYPEESADSKVCSVLAPSTNEPRRRTMSSDKLMERIAAKSRRVSHDLEQVAQQCRTLTIELHTAAFDREAYAQKSQELKDAMREHKRLETLRIRYAETFSTLAYELLDAKKEKQQ